MHESLTDYGGSPNINENKARSCITLKVFKTTDYTSKRRRIHHPRSLKKIPGPLPSIKIQVQAKVHDFIKTFFLESFEKFPQ